MNLQATKLELMQLILESKNKDLLNSVLNLFQSSDSGNIELSENEKAAIAQGMEDIRKGRTITSKEFFSRYDV